MRLRNNITSDGNKNLNKNKGEQDERQNNWKD
jgi:hypothetical protein